jgi:holo-ACP synthase CitX
MELMSQRPTNLRIGLTQMLAAREDRVTRQRIWLQRYGGSLISFCINMPGEIKDNAEAHQLQAAGVRAVQQALKAQGWPVTAHAVWRAITGPEAFWSVPIAAQRLKSAMIQLEQQHPLGRLFDLDVLDSDGRSLSRREFDLAPRRCLICDELAAACGRSRRHSSEALLAHIRQTLRTYSTQEQHHVCTL